VNRLPFEGDEFDWAWSVDCVGHPSVGDPVATLRELARVVKPGGPVVVLVYSSQMLLPGHAAFEARLNATASAMTRAAEGREAESDPLRALGWFREASLVAPWVRTLVRSVQAPLDEDTRRALISLIGMLWGDSESTMSETDREEFLRLTRPDSPDFILGSMDYYGFITYSMFEGRVRKGHQEAGLGADPA
jgi:SAM-dependent methyltransferase